VVIKQFSGAIENVVSIIEYAKPNPNNKLLKCAADHGVGF
jgi:hypothetical protein